MKISIHRTGGFAGLREEVARVDTGALPPDQAQAIQNQLAASRFFEMPAQVTSSVRGADFFRYEIAVSGPPGPSHRVSFTDDASEQSAPLRRLVDVVAAV